jgi:hypothetical protein
MAYYRSHLSNPLPYNKQHCTTCRNIAMPELKPVPGSQYFLWKYLPSVAPSAVFITGFTLVTLLHCWRTYRTRTWFAIPFAIGGLCEHISYPSQAQVLIVVRSQFRS